MKYRKRPVVIDALLWDGDVRPHHPVAEWVRSNGGRAGWSPETPQRLTIETLEGTMYAEPGDMIIRGVEGEFYPCKPGIFAATYEPVE